METDIKPKWQRVLDNSLTKVIGREKRELLPLFCEGFVNQDITEVIRNFLLSNTTLRSFSLSALFCFSKRYDKPVELFQIFYNDALKTNEAVWRVGDLDFCEFRECLIYYLVDQFCKKRNLNIKRKIKSVNKISDSELKEIIDDDGVLKFIRKLNEIKFFEIRNWLSSVRSGIENVQTLLERDIGELIFLMHENRKILEPYLKGSSFTKFFPDKSREADSLKSILRDRVTDLISIYALRFLLKNIINEEIGKNNNIDCFTENNGKFYRVLRFTESNKDAALHNKHQNVKLDIESSSDYWFEYLWVVKDVKEKIYFPEADAETIYRKSYERFNSYLTRNVEYLDENLGREVLLKDAKLWVCKKSLLEFLEKEKSKILEPQASFSENKDSLEFDNNINSIEYARTAITLLIENTVKELINSGNKDPKPLTVWKLISSKNPLPEPILKMTRKEGIFYTPLSSIDTDSMPYKTFSNRVGEYKKIFSVSKKLKKTDSSGT